MKLHRLITLMLLIGMLSAIKLSAQNNKQEVIPPYPDTTLSKAIKQEYLKVQKKAYRMALTNQDFMAAANALYCIIVLDKKMAWKDSLANLYFSNGAFVQCMAVARGILLEAPDNQRMLEMLAISEDSTGNLKGAIDAYERLYTQTQNIQILYLIATFQYTLKRYGECESSIQNLLNHPEINKATISIKESKDHPLQEVPLKAAVLNLRGVMLKELNKKEEAKKNFEEALQLFPEYILAKGNLEEMKKADGNTSKKKK